MTQQEILTQEIEGLDSLRFEKLCYILTDALSGKKLIHKGTDSRGQPRRSTVDSYSDDGTIVGEYSVDKNYFSDLSKPRGDINHALREHPQVNKIYLLSGVRMRPSEGKNITALCHEMQMCFQGDVFWYDAEELAKYILKDLLPKTEIVRRLSKFLPCLKSIYLSSPKHRLTMVNTPLNKALGVRNQIFHSKETRSAVAWTWERMMSATCRRSSKSMLSQFPRWEDKYSIFCGETLSAFSAAISFISP